MKSLTTIAFAAALLPTLACAAPVDFSAVIHNLDGGPAQECKQAEAKTIPGKNGEPDDHVTICKKVGPLTLGSLAANGLISADRGASADEQVKRGLLAQRVYAGKAVELTAEQVATIKAQVAKLGQPTLYVTQLVEAIDPAAVK